MAIDIEISHNKGRIQTQGTSQIQAPKVAIK